MTGMPVCIDILGLVIAARLCWDIEHRFGLLCVHRLLVL